MNYKNYKILFYISLYFLLNTSAFAQEQQPTKVLVGSYVESIFDLNLRENRVSIDFYLWFRWKGKDLKPHESFEIPNGKIISRTIYIDRPGTEENFSQVRIVATFYIDFNLQKFSLDQQNIPILIEDGISDTSQLVYVADTPNIAVRSSIKIPGYQISAQYSSIVDDIYVTNFGDPNFPPNSSSIYSQYSHNIAIERPGCTFFFKLFSGMFLGILLVSFGFLIRTEDVNNRIGFGVGAIFIIMSNNFSILNQLPSTHIITLADKIYYLSMGLVVFAMVLAVFSWRALNEHRKKLTNWLNRLGLSIPAIYLILIGLIVYFS